MCVRVCVRVRAYARVRAYKCTNKAHAMTMVDRRLLNHRDRFQNVPVNRVIFD